MSKCSVPKCDNSRAKGFSMFALPPEAGNLKDKWIFFLEAEGFLKNKINYNTLVCEAHFPQSSLIKHNHKTILKKNSAPQSNIIENYDAEGSISRRMVSKCSFIFFQTLNKFNYMSYNLKDGL